MFHLLAAERASGRLPWSPRPCRQPRASRGGALLHGPAGGSPGAHHAHREVVEVREVALVQAAGRRRARPRPPGRRAPRRRAAAPPPLPRADRRDRTSAHGRVQHDERPRPPTSEDFRGGDRDPARGRAWLGGGPRPSPKVFEPTPRGRARAAPRPLPAPARARPGGSGSARRGSPAPRARPRRRTPP